MEPIGYAWNQRFKIEKDIYKETIAEFMGTFLFLTNGFMITASEVLDRNQQFAAVTTPLGWGFSFIMAHIVAGNVSAGHFNPSVTIAMATVRKFPWKKVLPYIAAQYVSAFLSSVIVFVLFKESFDLFDGGERQIEGPNATAHIFVTFPRGEISTYTCFLDQVISTAFLSFVSSAVFARNPTNIHPSIRPLSVGFVLAGVIFAFNHNINSPFNPARDLAPRFFTAAAGWTWKVFSYRNYNFFWVPILAPHLGAIIGAWLYLILIEIHRFAKRERIDRRHRVYAWDAGAATLEEEMNSDKRRFSREMNTLA